MTDAAEERVSPGEAACRRLHAGIISCAGHAPGQRVTERGLAVKTGLGTSPVPGQRAR